MAVAFLSLLWVSVALPTAQGAPAAPSWSLLRTRNPLVPGGEFRSVSCPSVTSCVGVGYRIDIWGFEVSFAAIWDGTAWKFQETPNPPAASWTELWGVSCASATSCAAVGYYVGRSGENLPVAESWDGHRWKLQPTPPVSEGILLSVSCPSDIVCTTVGQYVNDRKWATLAEGWDGTAWTIQPTPNPPTAEDVNLTGVSCVSPSVCTAVGLDGEGGVDTALAEAWDGTAWTIQPTPHPQGMDGYLISVSCTAASACTGVGLDIGYGFALYALIERWDGTQVDDPELSSSPGQRHARRLVHDCD